MPALRRFVCRLPPGRDVARVEAARVARGRGGGRAGRRGRRAADPRYLEGEEAARGRREREMPD